jgi:hypothetical protein
VAGSAEKLIVDLSTVIILFLQLSFLLPIFVYNEKREMKPVSNNVADRLDIPQGIKHFYVSRYATFH